MKRIYEDLYREAQRFIPGGVNSPVRSFRMIGSPPIFMKKGEGAYLVGEGGERYLDFCLSWGAIILGHSHPRVKKRVLETIEDGMGFGTATKKEIEIARLIVEGVPSIDRVRFTSSGTEAVMGAVRLARAYTGKDKIIKFVGAYHGHADYLLAQAGSGMVTLTLPSSAGVPREFVKDTLLADYNSFGVVERLVQENKEEVGSIIVEPVMANCGIILPEKGFLESLREICNRHKMVLIFDEVITGFRLSFGGAQELFGVEPDLTVLGKILGGGLPIGAFGGREDIMSLLAPEGEVYQAGTLSGNPVSVSAGMEVLRILREENPYPVLQERTEQLCQGIEDRAAFYGIPIRVNRIASLFSIFFTREKVSDFNSAKRQDVDLFRKFYRFSLEEGIYFSPSCFEANFLSLAHGEEEINLVLKKLEKVFKKMRR